MENNLICEIDREIEARRDRIVKNTISLVNIKSVKDKPLPHAPFGEGNRKVLDKVLSLGREENFVVKDYDVGFVSIAFEEGVHDLGIWLHGDVVPEGEGWKFEPYNAVEYNGCIIGRGATDNKGQFAAIFEVLKVFKELGIKLKYNPVLYVGSDEETFKGDLLGEEGNPYAKGLLSVCTPPRLSFVPDSDFPVCLGGKGGMYVRLRSEKSVKGFIITAGLPDSVGTAQAVFDENCVPDDASKLKREGNTLSCYSLPRHAASPDPNGNMITMLCAELLKSDSVCDEDKEILSFLKDVSLDVYGENFGVATEHKNLGRLTVYPKSIENVNGCPELVLNIRFPMGITEDEIKEKISLFAQKRGFYISSSKHVASPFVIDENSEMVKMLCEVSKDVLGEGYEPYYMGGSTYANELPNAYVFGTGCNVPPDDFEKGRGEAHSVDEAASIDRLLKCSKIYARALLMLNDIKW